MPNQKKYTNTLFWKLMLTFLFMLIILGVAYVFLTAYTARMYVQETNQKLNWGIAEHTVQEAKPKIQNGIDTVAIQMIMQSMMAINPSVEVYLLNMSGGIITYVAPYKKVKLTKVDLSPVRSFINKADMPLILGDDPRNPGKKKIFSAAPIVEDGVETGYVYVILASEEYTSVTETLLGSYMLRLGTKGFFISLFAALLIGLMAVWLITRNLRGIVDAVRRFRDGDYNARVKENKSSGELSVLGSTYNDMADTIVKNIDELKKVENLRRELIANVSHDLRTPLAIMHGYVETMLMKDASLDPHERTRYLNIVLGSTEKLKNLVSQLFELSKLEAKQIEPLKEPFQISDLAQDISQKYKILAEEKGVKVNLNVSEKLPLVYADIALLERVIQNLMDNALKFTPEGGEVSLEITGGDSEIEVKISDTGPGIPETEQSYIFERYYKSGSEPGKQKSPGSGLGLAIVKRILELHNSTIKVISKPDQGASFLFSLPVHKTTVA